MKKVSSRSVVSLFDASVALGLGRLALESWLRMGSCPFGSYILGEGKKRGSYYINKVRLDSYLSGKK